MFEYLRFNPYFFLIKVSDSFLWHCLMFYFFTILQYFLDFYILLKSLLTDPIRILKKGRKINSVPDISEIFREVYCH